MFNVATGSFIVKERIQKGEIKICDSCGRILTADTIGAEDCFITEQGLVCAECVYKIKPTWVNQDNNIWNG
jgi:hypothetical protein